MTPESILRERLSAAKARDPYLGDLTVIRIAERNLERSGARSAVNRIAQDLDKIMDDEFSAFIRDAHEMYRAIDRIEDENSRTNGERGSNTARTIVKYLKLFKLGDARAHHRWDGDKLYQYPDLSRVIRSTIVGCDLHGIPYRCPTCDF